MVIELKIQTISGGMVQEKTAFPVKKYCAAVFHREDAREKEGFYCIENYAWSTLVHETFSRPTAE